MIARLLTLIFLAGFVVPAYAGDKINNGGGIWACEDGTTITKGFLIDIFEARDQWDLKLIQTKETDPYAIVSSVMSRLQKEFSDLYVNVNPRLQAVKANARFRDIALVDIPDTNNFSTPYPAECKTGAWQKVQFANYRGDGELFIRKDLWDGSVLTPLDKAGLILHESVYLWLRTDYNDQDSTRARHIVGLMLSTLPMEQINTEVRKVLWGNYTPGPPPAPTPEPPMPPTPSRQNFLCIIDNPPLNVTYGAYGDDEFSARTSAKLTCNQGPSAFSCADGNMECSPLTPAANWTCTSKNNMSGKIFVANGRTQFEAQFNALVQCQQDHGQAFACASRAFMDCAQR